MEHFRMCETCAREYADPTDRRFHAQPNACSACGPSLTAWDADGAEIEKGDSALQVAADALRAGRIVAVKGLGGFHLMVDARNAPAIDRLRESKPRREKPLALMVRDVAQASELCEVDARAASVLRSPEAPIVLLTRKSDAAVADSVAPGNPRLGLMLPYTPLHHLLLRTLGFPVVATSGNLADEPICTDEQEAVVRLAGIAELYLVHDRPVARHVDDSIVWITGGEPAMLRRARGFAPRPVLLEDDVPVILAVGAHLKNAVALGVGRQVFVSQHIGDLETPQALAAFERVVAEFLDLYEARPVAVAHDSHPDYPSTQWARGSDPASLEGVPRIAVGHHHAHLASCLAENHERGPALGVIWDGTGYGADGTIWGGEFLVGDAAGYRRVAHLRPFSLPGGEAAIREPRRSALALLWETEGRRGLARRELAPVRAFDDAGRSVLAGMLEEGVNSPRTSSAGRLFDAVASLLGLRQQSSFEGQAAMELEWTVDPEAEGAYAFGYFAQQEKIEGGQKLVLDWHPLLVEILDDLGKGVPTGTIAARFHNALADAILRVATFAGQATVALSGGCFQNRHLVEASSRRLVEAGFRVLLQRQVPANDGGIALGQVAIAAAKLS
jgi:hydrogenase maturation protein HypF